MNPLTHFKTTKVLRNIFLSLGAIFALAITAHAQNLYVSAHTPGTGEYHHSILEFTPSGVQSTYASGLSFPRGLAFDSLGNLFAAETLAPADDVEVGKVLKFNLRNKATTLGSAAQFFFEGLAIDNAGNVYVMGTDTSPTAGGTIFKFTPSGERVVFGSVPGEPDNPVSNFGRVFDSTGNLFVAEAGVPEEFPSGDVLKFPPGGGPPTLFASGLFRPEFLTFGPPR